MIPTQILEAKPRAMKPYITKGPFYVDIPQENNRFSLLDDFEWGLWFGRKNHESGPTFNVWRPLFSIAINRKSKTYVHDVTWCVMLTLGLFLGMSL